MQQEGEKRMIQIIRRLENILLTCYNNPVGLVNIILVTG